MMMNKDLGMGHLGNGVTIWDRTREKDGDYLTIAHISYNRQVTYYVDDISIVDKAEIGYFAKHKNISISTTQVGYALQPVLRLRFVYSDNGNCRDIYEAIDETKYCRMEERFQACDYVSWYSVTEDWEEPLCPISTEVHVQIVDQEDNIIATEQNKRYGEETLADKTYPFSWEKPDESIVDVFHRLYNQQ